MQDNFAALPMQPFFKLVQKNMELTTKFFVSPEFTAQSMEFMQQGKQGATNLAHSSAFAQLMQGLVQNYTEFMTETGSSAMSALVQGQASMMQRARDSAFVAGEGANSQSHRGRNA